MSVPPHIVLVATLLVLTWQMIGDSMKVTALVALNLRRVGTMLLYHGVVMLSSVCVGGFVRIGHGLGALSRV